MASKKEPEMSRTVTVQPSSMQYEVNRPCREHTFLTHIEDVQRMEENLLQLLDDFNTGKLLAFGSGSPFDKQLDAVRGQQEDLMRFHFRMDQEMQQQAVSQQDPVSLRGKLVNKKDTSCLLTEDGRKKAKENMESLVNQLEALSVSIRNLHSTQQ